MPETILYFAYVWFVPVILYACPLLEIYDSQPPKIHNFAPEIDPPSEIFFWLLPWCFLLYGMQLPKFLNNFC